MVLKLGSQVQGLIREMLVDRGDVVRQGRFVARLESGRRCRADDRQGARGETIRRFSPIAPKPTSETQGRPFQGTPQDRSHDDLDGRGGGKQQPR